MLLQPVLRVSAINMASAATIASTDPVVPILMVLLLIGLGAAAGGWLMRKLGQPAVLGELLFGIIFANIGYYFHEPVLTLLRDSDAVTKIIEVARTQQLSISDAVPRVLSDGERTRRLAESLQGPLASAALSIQQFVAPLSRIAVLVLLFLVGLETRIHQLRQVGWSAFRVAIVGVMCPFAFGAGAVQMLMPGEPVNAAIFIGGILTATSVGITARVFRDLKMLHRTEAHVILGAAVIDDVLGLIVLSVVSGLVVSGTVSVFGAAAITLKSTLFLVAAIGLGAWLAPHLVRRLVRLEIENVKVLFGLGFAFVLAWLADLAGLAAIVGAFAAGLVLEDSFLDELKGQSLRELLSPIEALVVPLFFVLMGMQVKLEAFADFKILLMAAVLTVLAVAGKLVSGLACSAKLDRVSVGVGMMPRGEVGLIFASVGKGLGVVSDAMFSAVVLMVMITTLLTPPLLKVTLARSEKPE